MPDISPSSGEIGSFGASLSPARSAIGESRRDIQSPPLRGRCPA
ncbi:alpha/beta hydrolase, partial [Mesorhizobium sp. M7A.F.Ca.US.005.03.2.1]